MIALLLLLIGFPVRPDPIKTPGAVATTRAADVCTAGYAGAHRNVSTTRKRAVYRSYGIVPTGHWSPTHVYQSDFEIDHSIALQLGGSNEITNLWPQSYHTTPYNATRKDDLENRLHWLVCHRQLTLIDAQQLIRTDWIAAYRRFFDLHSSSLLVSPTR